MVEVEWMSIIKKEMEMEVEMRGKKSAEEPALRALHRRHRPTSLLTSTWTRCCCWLRHPAEQFKDSRRRRMEGGDQGRRNGG